MRKTIQINLMWINLLIKIIFSFSISVIKEKYFKVSKELFKYEFFFCDSDFNEVERLKKVGKKINFISSAEEGSAERYINEELKFEATSIEIIDKDLALEHELGTRGSQLLE